MSGVGGRNDAGMLELVLVEWQWISGNLSLARTAPAANDARCLALCTGQRYHVVIVMKITQPPYVYVEATLDSEGRR
jgi:hypothetical protein